MFILHVPGNFVVVRYRSIDEHLCFRVFIWWYFGSYAPIFIYFVNLMLTLPFIISSIVKYLRSLGMQVWSLFSLLLKLFVFRYDSKTLFFFYYSSVVWLNKSEPFKLFVKPRKWIFQLGFVCSLLRGRETYFAPSSYKHKGVVKNSIFWVILKA